MNNFHLKQNMKNNLKLDKLSRLDILICYRLCSIHEVIALLVSSSQVLVQHTEA